MISVRFFAQAGCAIGSQGNGRSRFAALRVGELFSPVKTADERFRWARGQTIALPVLRTMRNTRYPALRSDARAHATTATVVASCGPAFGP